MLTPLTLIACLCCEPADMQAEYEQILEENADNEAYYTRFNPYLSDQERRDCYNRCEYATREMLHLLELAEEEAMAIRSPRYRRIAAQAIRGAIAAAPTRNAYTVAISGTLGAIAERVTDAGEHWLNARHYLIRARVWARIAEEWQEKLWRDE